MNSMEIKNIMQSNEKTKKVFKGVYACDRLPKRITRKPACLIVNTDPAHKPGTHWIAIYISKSGKSEYFDSYGNPPYLKSVINFMYRHGNGYIYNMKQLQSLFSSYCGNYCCQYILHRSHGCSFKTFISSFSNSTINNDKILIKNFRKNFKNK